MLPSLAKVLLQGPPESVEKTEKKKQHPEQHLQQSTTVRDDQRFETTCRTSEAHAPFFQDAFSCWVNRASM